MFIGISSCWIVLESNGSRVLCHSDIVAAQDLFTVNLFFLGFMIIFTVYDDGELETKFYVL